MPSPQKSDSEAFCETLATVLQQQLELQEQHLEFQRAAVKALELHGAAEALGTPKGSSEGTGCTEEPKVILGGLLPEVTDEVPEAQLPAPVHACNNFQAAEFSALTRWVYRLQGVWPEKSLIGRMYHWWILALMLFTLCSRLGEVCFFDSHEGQDDVVGRALAVGLILLSCLQIASLHELRSSLLQNGSLYQLVRTTGRNYNWKETDRLTTICFTLSFFLGLITSVIIQIVSVAFNMGAWTEAISESKSGEWILWYKWTRAVIDGLELPFAITLLFTYVASGYLRASLHCQDFRDFVPAVEEAMTSASKEDAVARLNNAETLMFVRLSQTNATWGRMMGWYGMSFAYLFLAVMLIGFGRSGETAPFVYPSLALLSLGFLGIFCIAAMVADCWRLEISDKLNMPRLLSASQTALGNMPATHFSLKARSHGIRIFGSVVDSEGVARITLGLVVTLMITFMRAAF